jgi:glutaminase A-like protein
VGGDVVTKTFQQGFSQRRKRCFIIDEKNSLAVTPCEGNSVAKKECSLYRRMQGRYGLALDNRRMYTKLDWITWTATAPN